MAIQVDPSNSPIITGMPSQPKKKQSITATSSAGPIVFDMSPGEGDATKKGVRILGEDAKGIAGIIDVTSKKRMFCGDPRLPDLLDSYMNHITGERNFGKAGNAARFGFVGITARRLPPPIMFDSPDLVSLLGDTMCVDNVGRMFVYAPFFKELLKEESLRKTAILPILVHELLHVILDHPNRMLQFDHRMVNIAQDRVINPMAKRMFDPTEVFADIFLKAYGNRVEDKIYMDLAEETVLKMMMSEMAEKGTIKIGTLTIVDGPVTGTTTHSAAKGEINDLGDITVTVQDNGMSDSLDTIFDCGVMHIDKIDNQLKPRNRPGSPGKQEGSDKPIMIPNVNPNNILEGLGDGAPGGDPSGHMIDTETLIAGLKERGYDHVVGDLKLQEQDPKAVERVIEQSMSEALQERNQIGQAYPGEHIESHMKDVVKPSKGYDITWDRRVKEFVTGTGPILSRSIDEPGLINFIDPHDMNMTEDDRVYMAGLLPQKPEDIMVIMIDSSGSVDNERAAKFISLAISMRSSADDMSPNIMIVMADTVIRGAPVDLDDDTLTDIAENGMDFLGRGGTDVIAPLNQIMKYARDNDITISGIIYATDLGICPINPELLPEDLPALMFVAIPSDYKACSQVVAGLQDVAEVVMIEKNMDLNFDLAEQRSSNRGRGIAMK